MQLRRSRVTPRLCFVFLICAASLTPQTTDRIQSFDSLINVDRDRTIHVTERILLANENGFFDGGVHRQLRTNQRPRSGQKPARSIRSLPQSMGNQEPSNWVSLKTNSTPESPRIPGAIAGKPSH